MFTVTGKQQFGSVWKDGKCIATFRHGVATTDDAGVAEYLSCLGYTVEGEAPAADPLARMKKDNLKKYAAENGIDLTGIPDKAKDILAAIKAAEAANESPASGSAENGSEA